MHKNYHTYNAYQATNEEAPMNALMPSRPSQKRIPVSIRLLPELVARARNLVRDEAGKPRFLTLTSLTEAALETEMARIERLVEDADDADRNLSAAVTKRRINHHQKSETRS